MKKNNINTRIWGSIAAILLASIGLMGCDEAPEPTILGVPANLSVEVVGRLATISWSAVSGASGYEIYSRSPGCGSGNRTVNTATQGALNNNTGSAIAGGSIYTSLEAFNAAKPTLKTAMGGGQIVFIDDTTIGIWLMSMSGSNLTEVMATSIIVKVKAVGDGVDYFDSADSLTVEVVKANYQSEL